MALRNVNLINVSLLTAIALFSLYILPPLLGAKVNYTPPKAKKVVEEKEEKKVETPAPSPMEYTVIADQNLFHPDRKIPVEKVAAPPLPKPEFVLFGTLVTGDSGVAFLEDKKEPYSTSGRGKRQKRLSRGETMSGFTLSEVYNDKVVMTRGEEKIEVKVLDTAKARAEGGGITTAATGSRPAASSPGAAPARPGQVTPAASGTVPAAQRADRRRIAAGQRQTPMVPNPLSGPIPVITPPAAPAPPVPEE